MANWLGAHDMPGSAFAPPRGDANAGAAIPLGKLKTDHGAATQPIAYHGRAHMFCVAPSGAGKSQALAIPALLTWPHSVIVLDVKGELYYRTAGYRIATLGQKVYRFDPSDPGSNKFNPLAFINRDTFQIEQSIADIAEVLVPIPPNAREPFFLRAARQIIEIVLHYECVESPETVSMQDFLASCYDPALFLRLVEEIGQDDEQKFLKSTQNLARGLRGQFFESDGRLTRTAQSVWAELSNQLAALNTEQIREITNDTHWQPLDLRKGNTTVYVTLPPNAKGQYRTIMALVLNAHLGLLLDRLPEHDAPPTLLLLDEMPQLGHMRGIEQVIDLGRGYGLLLYGFAQRRKQIEDAYGSAGDFLGTFEARAYMNPSPEDGSAEMLSRAIGERQVPAMSGGGMQQVPVAPIHDLCGQSFRDDIIVLSRGASPARVQKEFVTSNPVLKDRLDQDAPAREKYAPTASSMPDRGEV